MANGKDFVETLTMITRLHYMPYYSKDVGGVFCSRPSFLLYSHNTAIYHSRYIRSIHKEQLAGPPSSDGRALDF